MSLSDVVARMSEIQALAGRTLAPADISQPQVAPSAFHGAVAELSSPDELSSSYALPPSSPVPSQTTAPAAALWGGTSSGSRVLDAAETQVGVSEQPPGSNDGPELAGYRSAVAGAAPGEPWCAYFASWAAAQAGAPLGDA